MRKKEQNLIMCGGMTFKNRNKPAWPGNTAYPEKVSLEGDFFVLDLKGGGTISFPVWSAPEFFGQINCFINAVLPPAATRR